MVSSGKGGEPPLPGSSSFPMGTLEKVYAVNRRRGGPAPGSTAASGHSPTWSPNGGAVIFTQRSATSSKVMRVSGSSATATATVLIPNASQPDWQPVR